MRALALTAALSVLVVLGGCDRFGSGAPAPIRKRGELRVVTLNLPTCYYLGAQSTEGLEYQLASAFAVRLRVKLFMYPVADERAMQAELAAGRADIAACSLTTSPDWSRAALPSEPYSRIPQLVVYRHSGVRPRETAQLRNATLAVRPGSPQENTLRGLKQTVAPGLRWIETAPSSADPMEDVDSGAAQYALMDAREFSFAHHLYPNVLVGFTLPDQRPVQWMVRRDERALLSRVNSFFRDLAASGLLAELMQNSSGDTRPFEYEESREFQTHVAERLPLYRALFEKAAANSGIDWRLLAAIGYQESKWDPHAQSGDGALGVMMLTADTAQAMGIKDRNNPQDSILAGARYFAEVRDKIPDRISEPDRTWFSLAAYNVGFGHVEDARIITQSQGKDPDSWAQVREVLPLLAEERYYEQAKRGYARGWEPVQFVDRIQRFLKLLEGQPGEAATLVRTTPPPMSSPTSVGPAPATAVAPASVIAPAPEAAISAAASATVSGSLRSAVPPHAAPLATPIAPAGPHAVLPPPAAPVTTATAATSR
jgi:membrane-bound lytic murein transglycosylase F